MTRRQLREAAAAAARTAGAAAPAPAIPTPAPSQTAPSAAGPAWSAGPAEAPAVRSRRAQQQPATPPAPAWPETVAPAWPAPEMRGTGRAPDERRVVPQPVLADVLPTPRPAVDPVPAAEQPAQRRRAARAEDEAAAPEAADGPGRPARQPRAEQRDVADEGPEPRPLPRGRRAVGRMGVLAALVGVTVVIPISQGMAEGDFEVLPSLEPDYPSTVAALTALPLSDLPPTSLVSEDGTARLRELSDVSRAADRDPLPGCDGSTRPTGSNGQLATADLCTLWDGRQQLRADAAVALAELNEAFVARFGTDICLTDGYRTLAEQYTLKAQKGGLAATPGKSNHGWGLAVDICGLQPGTSRWTWMNDNAPVYGWENPTWAKSGGSGPYEPWHWEYIKGVKADGSYYG